jgi:hypothetical protein
MTSFSQPALPINVVFLLSLSVRLAHPSLQCQIVQFDEQTLQGVKSLGNSSVEGGLGVKSTGVKALPAQMQKVEHRPDSLHEFLCLLLCQIGPHAGGPSERSPEYRVAFARCDNELELP